jgi:hypothetical protein
MLTSSHQWSFSPSYKVASREERESSPYEKLQFFILSGQKVLLLDEKEIIDKYPQLTYPI